MTADKKPQVLFLWLILAAAAGLAFTQSAYFIVREVEITGLGRLTREEMLSVAGVEPPVNVFSVNPRAVEARLLAYPAVAEAKVFRRFPSHLRIDLTERRPVGVLPYGEHYLLFDGAGVPFAVRRPEEARGLPVVTGIRPHPVRLGKPSDSPAVRWVATVLQSLPAGLRRRVEGVEAAPGLAVTLVLDDGIRANLGGQERMGQKLGLLQSILAEAAAAGWRVKEIDLRNPDQPYLKKFEDGPPAPGKEAGRG